MPDTLKIIFWNARGLRNKFIELEQFIHDYSIDIICINETFLTDTVSLPNIPNFSFYRADGTNHSGGLLMMIKNSIEHEPLNGSQMTTIVECMTMRIKARRAFTLSLVYCRGGPRQIASLRSNLIPEITALCDPSEPFFIVGDFNSKHRSWTCSRPNTAGKLLKQFIDDSGLHLLFPDSHTYNPTSLQMSPSTIDLIITNGIIPCSDPEAIEIFTSDHYPVSFEIHNTYSPLSGCATQIYNYTKANWPLFQTEIDWRIRPLLNTYSARSNIPNSSIDHLVEKLTHAITDAEAISVPTISNKKSEFIMTPELRELITARNYYRKRFTRNRDPVSNLQFNELKKRVKTLINHLKCEKLNSILLDSNANNNNIYKVIKTRRHIYIPHLKPSSPNDRLITSNPAKAQALASHFANCHINQLSNHLKSHTSIVNRTVNNFLNSSSQTTPHMVDVDEIYSNIKNSKNNKASGLDKVNIRTVKKLPPAAIHFLTLIFNFCFHNCYFPTAWKKSKTIPIPKPGKDSTLVSSYRPIALLSCLSKLFEKSILNYLLYEFSYINPFKDYQFGFRSGHSTSHAICYLTNHIRTALKNRLTTGVIYFDIEKAFDSVWHNGLLYKLINMGCNHNLVKLVHQFLSLRAFEVHLGTHISDTKRVPFGVPQGSVLSPTLYNVFMSDFPNLQSKVAVYADDTAIFSSSRFSKKVVKRLQSDARRLVRFFNRWKIRINAGKTVVMFHTKRRLKQLPPNEMTINGTQVPVTSTARYLGVHLDNRLTFKDHMDKKCLQASNAIRRLYPFLRRNNFATKKLKLKIYKTYIRPILSYGAPIISDASVSQKLKLERKQNQAMRLVLNAQRSAKIREMQTKLKLESMSEFLQRIQRKFLEKCEFSENLIIEQLFLGRGGGT